MGLNKKLHCSSVQTKGRYQEVLLIVDTLHKEGCSIDVFNNGAVYRINDLINIYGEDGKVYSITTKEMIKTTKKDIRAVIDAFIWEID